LLSQKTGGPPAAWAFPLIRVQGRAFSSYESTTIAPKARPREMLMTTQNSVSHMAYLLEPGCKRRKSGETNAPEGPAFPTFLEGRCTGKNARNRLLM